MCVCIQPNEDDQDDPTSLLLPSKRFSAKVVRNMFQLPLELQIIFFKFRCKSIIDVRSGLVEQAYQVSPKSGEDAHYFKSTVLIQWLPLFKMMPMLLLTKPSQDAQVFS